ncbi:uncharacterized protein LOC123649091 [Lemur catta]|uniref:uncharacterized protein LOC123649091 n=1 Tax=Lemur catta TaxID=9447 RepID=UPI001E2675FB|nr:uncharacterized protein LOC123649091 [Lemur catta]
MEATARKVAGSIPARAQRLWGHLSSCGLRKPVRSPLTPARSLAPNRCACPPKARPTHQPPPTCAGSRHARPQDCTAGSAATPTRPFGGSVPQPNQPPVPAAALPSRAGSRGGACGPERVELGGRGLGRKARALGVVPSRGDSRGVRGDSGPGARRVPRAYAEAWRLDMKSGQVGVGVSCREDDPVEFLERKKLGTNFPFCPAHPNDAQLHPNLHLPFQSVQPSSNIKCQRVECFFKITPEKGSKNSETALPTHFISYCCHSFFSGSSCSSQDEAVMSAPRGWLHQYLRSPYLLFTDCCSARCASHNSGNGKAKPSLLSDTTRVAGCFPQLQYPHQVVSPLLIFF